jgi:hypothetical protein
LLIFLVLLLLGQSFSQSCLPDGITFYSQSDIDDFPVNNPGCTEIEGDVTIGYDGYLTDISNLDGLSAVTAIGGFLYINTNENLADFSGLNALETIGGDLIVENNDGVTDMTGFDALTTIEGDLFLVENDNLASLTGLESLTTINGMLEMGHNLTFSAFTGLSGLTHTGGIEMNYIHQMPDMTGFSSLTQIDGDLIINSCNGLVNMGGLDLLETITGSFSINTSQSMESFNGLEGCTSVGGNLDILDCDKLENITALSNLTEVGGNLHIGGCAMLQSLSGLESLTSIGDHLHISGNSLFTNLTGIDNIAPQSIVDLTISYNPLLAQCEVQSICEYLQSPGGQVTIRDNAAGCSSEAEVSGACGTGIEDNENELQFSIYPNPVGQVMMIAMEENYEIGKIAIFDEMGREVLLADPEDKVIDISGLSRGLYIIGITTTEGGARRLFVKE